MDISVGGKEFRRYLPGNVAQCFTDTWDADEVENVEQLTNMASAIFVGLLSAGERAPVRSGGGGSQSDLPWRDKNDDDLM